ncbi:DUF4235 domain-containing protein [Nocardioides acrostichi]|uniref:DUF4235 domain-containing protein n=1 Tax=Nocardioides acrostichi TaxID=2784339 RepID=A0A930Y6I3_9ACTN|nr:DUF4235 domain-containing protein [Nocardioides acrostichi]MBF4160971.1 DUF4235 domain-containing protein [Nocardioides acrostichi]
MAKNKAPGQGGAKVWSAMSLVSALGAAAVARKALNTGWKTATKRNPPDNPADPDVEMWEAVSWAMATGAGVALARMIAQRRAAEYFVKSTGHLPPALQKDGK